MANFLSLVLSGAVAGAVFAIMASGLVLTVTTSGIFNFAHGAIAFSTAFVYFQLREAGMSIVPAVIISVFVFAPALGLALDRMMLRRLAAAPPYARIVGTVGLLAALPNFTLWVVEQWNLRGGDLPTNQQVILAPSVGPFPAKRWELASGVTIDSNQVAVLIAAVLATAAMWFVVRRSRLGLLLRADVDRRQLAALRGVDTARVSTAAWAMSTVLAGLGGVLLGPFLGLDPMTYTFVILGSIAAVVVARFRSLPIAIAVGLALGVVQNLVAGYADDFLPDFIAELSGLRTAIPFLLALFALMAIKPAAVAAGGEAAPDDPRAGMGPLRRYGPWVAATIALLVYVAFVADDYWATLLARGGVLSIIFLSIVVVTGLGGMVSLGQAAFVTAGGFTCGWLATHRFDWDLPVVMPNGHLNYIVAALAAAVVAMLAGLLVATSVRRLSALTLALATLMIAFAADLMIFQFPSVNNDRRGYEVDVEGVSWLDLTNPRVQLYLFLGIFGLLTLLVSNVVKSRTGRAVLAVRSSERAAVMSGMSPHRSRVIVFGLSAAIAGLGGALFPISSGAFTPTTTPPFIGLVWITVVVTMGVRRPGGALLAGLTFGTGPGLYGAIFGFNQALDEMTGSTYFQPLMFGLATIQLAREPDGILALMSNNRARRRRARLASREAQHIEVLAEDLSPQRRAVEAPVQPTSARLLISGLHAGYGDLEVLKDVHLAVQPGRIVAVVGANGAGKSTLCASIAGLLPTTSGTIQLEGKDLTALRAHDRTRAGLVVVPESRGVFPGLTVEDNLRVWLRSEDERRQAYDRFPILDQRRKLAAGLLSGGEQQMLALVGMLVRPPRVLILDEPTLGLAPLVCEAVWDKILELRDLGVSIVAVEEKTTYVMRHADEVVVLDLGRVAWSGARDEVDAAELTATYLGST